MSLIKIRHQPMGRQVCLTMPANELLKSEKEKIQKIDPSVTGFNVGINSGKSSGQTIFHVHIHLIPRRDNDIKDPRGGVRGVIPNKKSY
ncbi:HIT domain-containing protein [Amylibacter sp.]|nr:HIT domain-containing protein [Amylibacter sp.]